MVSLFNFLPQLPQRSPLRRRPLTEHDLIRREAAIGAQLFGPIPAGHRREFFCLDENTWIWHEEWVDLDGKRHLITTRYEIRGQQVIKAQGSMPYQVVSGAEAEHLLAAVNLYHERVMREVYGRAPQAA